jgi:hypothetical protein
MAYVSKKPESTTHVPYRPEMDMQQVSRFDAHLRNVPGSWTMTHSFLHAGDPRVVSLRWIIPKERWCDEAGFLNFLDQRHHRLLLHCFLQSVASDPLPLVVERTPSEAEVVPQESECQWDRSALLEQMGPAVKLHQLTQALHFLQVQEIVHEEEQDKWSRGRQIKPVATIDATFEWIVQEHLQRFHHALARRCVSFKEWERSDLNDLHVLAFTDDGLVMMVECKSNPDISGEDITRFIQRASSFPADIALLLIDTESEQQVVEQIQQMNTILGRELTDLGNIHQHKGSVIAHLGGNLYVANTAGGIEATLEETLHIGATWKASREGDNDPVSSFSSGR